MCTSRQKADQHALCWWQYVLAAVLRSGGYSRKELEAKDKEELYKLRIAALKRMVRDVTASASRCRSHPTELARGRTFAAEPV